MAKKKVVRKVAAVKVRKVRHWRQRLDPTASFIFRRRLVYRGKAFNKGDAVPKSLVENPMKLRNFWESKTIEIVRRNGKSER